MSHDIFWKSTENPHVRIQTVKQTTEIMNMNAISEFIWSSDNAAVNPNQQACLCRKRPEQTEQVTSSAVLQDIIQHV